MPEFSSRFAVINKIKSLLQKSGYSLLPKRNLGISEAFARKIQRTAFELAKQPKTDVNTNPYFCISEQLQSSNNHIVKSAIYYLSNIAVNEPSRTEDIINILKAHLQTAKNNQEQKDYISERILFINNNRRLK